MKKFVSVLIVIMMVVSMAGLGCTEQSTTEKTDQIYVVKLGPSDMKSQLRSGDIDGFIAWEPFNAEAVQAGYGKYLVQSSEVWPNHPCCVLATADSYEDEKAIKALVWAHVKATRWINNPENHDELVNYSMEFTGKDRATIEEALSNINYVEYPSESEFRTYYHKLEEGDITTQSLGDLGYEGEDAFFNDFLVKSYYEEVSQKLDENPNWKPEAVSSNVRLGYLTADLHEVAVYVAQEEGYYEEVGLTPGENLQLKQYSNGPAVMNAFKAGEIDASYLGGAPATLKRINDDTRIHIVAGANNEGSAIVVGADSGINSTEDLAGKTIAIPGFGTVQDFILRQVANNAGLTIQLKG